METPHLAPEQDEQPSQARSPRFLRALRTRERSGQAMVEFAFVSVAFLALIFGTVDFGRVIFMYSQLHSSVQEGARYGKMNPTANFDIEEIILNSGSSLNIQPDDISIHCTGGCYPGCSDITVEATARFYPLTAKLLGLGPEDLPIVMHSSATVTSE